MEATNKLFTKILFLIIIFIILIALILIYIGPITTVFVKKRLKETSTDIVVSLTTTPYRIDQIQPVLKSIARQSIKPTRVYVNIPIIFKRENKEYVIPEWLKNDPNIIINRTEDYGPATKLIPTLQKEHDPKTIIITIDDDHIYSKHIVRDLVKQYMLSTNNNNYKADPAITTYGLHFFIEQNRIVPIPLILQGQPSLVVMGFGGVAYRRAFFKDDIFLLLKDLPISCFLSDDLMISAYLLVNNINILKASSFYYNFHSVTLLSLTKILPAHFTDDALQNGANRVGFGSNEVNYAQCLNELPKYNKSIYRQVIMERSEMITNLYQDSEHWFVFMQLLYIFVYKMIIIIPFLKKIIIATMV